MFTNKLLFIKNWLPSEGCPLVRTTMGSELKTLLCCFVTRQRGRWVKYCLLQTDLLSAVMSVKLFE